MVEQYAPFEKLCRISDLVTIKLHFWRDGDEFLAVSRPQAKLKLLCPSCLSMSKEVSSLKFFISPCMKKKHTEQYSPFEELCRISDLVTIKLHFWRDGDEAVIYERIWVTSTVVGEEW